MAGTVPAGAATRPALVVEASRSSVTLYRTTYEDENGHEESYMEGDLGIYAVADLKQKFEVRVTRKDYDTPVVARLVRKGHDRTLPVPADFSGLSGFSRTTFRDSKGAVVKTSVSTYCPNVYRPVRRSPKAPAESPYPQGCNGNPYSLGAVWGLQAGYAASLTGGDGYYGFSDLPDLKPGRYLATTSITPAYREALRIPASKAQASVVVTVEQRDEGDCDEFGCFRTAHARTVAQRTAATGTTAAPKKLVGAKVKPSGPLPDLRSLPAWGISADGHYLNFGATVWNGGPGRLVVDGFRDPQDADLMHAYQYFFTASGKQKGYAPVGGMEWDARDTHQHWHFKDFARYRLVAADKKTLVVDSGKEAFCLANTDMVDYTVKGANWKPENTDLSTACGNREALGVREVLDPGSGDTYTQYREGQAFDLTTVANGTYYIEIAANPDRVLHERSTRNNVSLRQVVIGGTKDARTVKVGKVGLVDEPPVDDSGEARLHR
ncbi:lysyl oxidase family protein [Microlunatus flavus]|uniref:Lysyl oxidase n=1 Tax=Microlunatus flavus TaxID=1036181 RepID=A0A1H9GEZ3_9ACTN|nr:lysyl oxidase family protein [Microlunatus flavus]SEQ48682.1 Lysyl oxidase [Microlunatus flavus]